MRVTQTECSHFVSYFVLNKSKSDKNIGDEDDVR